MPRFSQKTLLVSASEMVSFWIIAAEIPMSLNNIRKPVNATAIATKPKSSGINSLAKQMLDMTSNNNFIACEAKTTRSPRAECSDIVCWSIACPK